MSARFVNVDRRTPLLLPCDMREWVQDDDRAHLVIEAEYCKKVQGTYAPLRHYGMMLYFSGGEPVLK